MAAKNQPRSPVAIFSRSRSSGWTGSSRGRAAIARSIAVLLCGSERRERDRIADAHASGNCNRAVDAERERLIPALAAIVGERSERVEGRDAGVGVLRGDGAAPDVAVQLED